MPEEFNIKKIDNYRWEIPKSEGMRVPGLLYADEKMLKTVQKDRTPLQVKNVAYLPGIIKYSLAMPDMHWGYGFCLTKDTKVLSNFGFYKAIGDFEKDWQDQRLKCIDLNSQRPVDTPIIRFIKLKPNQVFRIVTKRGYSIKATLDHPLFTPFGMKPVKDIAPDEKVAIFPFKGVLYKKPSSKIIISEEDIKKTLLKLRRKPGTFKFEIIPQKLKGRNLLPLAYDHLKLPYILKIMGFVFGDGSMNFIGKRGDGVLHFSGKPQDLEEARKDLEKIDYTPSPLHYQKTRDSRGSNKYYDCCSFTVNASSLVVLLETLGVPRGSKVSQAYRVPKWIFKAPLWQKRLFLASLFGCELRIPHRRLDRRGYFNAPVFPMAKREELIENGKDFLEDIAKLLKDFGVKSLYIDKRKKHINTKGKISWALELIISPKPKNLLNLWGKIGFEYNFKRAYIANVAVQYLKLKQKILKEKELAIKEKVPQLLRTGLSYQEIANQLVSNPLTKRFIIDICWKLNKGKKIIPRIPANFPLFGDYLEDITSGLEKSGMVWDEVKKIEKIDYKDFVYDFTVTHPEHNFIAENFVVSNCIGGVAATDPDEGGVISPGGIGYDVNCGIRLMRTNLTLPDVKDKLRHLLAALFNNIPCGVGSTSSLKLSFHELRRVLKEGAKWAIKQGYGSKDDLERTEDYGRMEGADPEKVSQQALKRGNNQLGTLGSGNHFLEIDLVEEIYLPQIAEVFGIARNQIVVTIHCGSRGLGYQVCDDYLARMRHAVDKYHISLPDRQLSCAPLTSPEGKDYFAGMAAAANYAWTNRQIIMHWTREVFQRVLNLSPRDLGMDLIYDVCHNIGKFEDHLVNGKKRKIFVHRKGATRAFPAHHPLLPSVYQSVGQPVLVPGDMGTNSYVMVGTPQAMEESWGSTCHGAGRVMSRSRARKVARGRALEKELEDKGILVMAKGRETIAEEMPESYKDVDHVVEIVEKANLSRKVAKLRPLGVIKG